MATSGTIYLYTDEETPSFSARIVWSASTNTSTFKSTVSWYIQARRTTAYTNNSGYSGFIDFIDDNATQLSSKNLSCGTISVGTSWVSIPGFSGSFTVSHNRTTGATPKIWVNCVFTGSVNKVGFLTDRYASISVSSIAIAATISSAPNFNDEESPTITYYNTSGSRTTSLQAAIYLDEDTPAAEYRDISMSETSYTFELTDDERNILRNATMGTNTRNVIFYVKSVVNGYTYTRSLTKTLTIINCEPTIHSTYYDTNAKTVALTQNNEIFIRGYSDIEFQVEATAKKGASITGYNTICGSKSSTLQKSTFYWADANEIIFTVSDNRGQSPSLAYQLDMVDYFPPTCSFEASDIALDAEGGTSATAACVVKGQFFNSTFGADGVKNALKIEVLHTGLEEWFEIPDILWGDNIEGNNYTCSFTVKGLNYKEKIEFQFRVSDKLTTTPVATDKKALKLEPVFDWGEEDFNFNVPVNINGDLTVSGTITIGDSGMGGAVDYIIEQGTEAMGSNGTWYWEKWKSGKAVCYGVRNFGNMSVGSVWGSLYEAGPFTQEFPADLFVEAPFVVNMNIQQTSAGAFLEMSSNDTFSETSTGKFYVVKATSGTLSAVHICFHCIGRWE